MKLTDVDLNELLPIYAQGQPIANAIGESVASALGAIFGRCESLPCEASSVACDAMRDDELDRVAQDLQIVIYDPSARHEEKARFVYEFAGTRYTAGSYANLKKGLSIFADIPEGDVRIERESTWRYYIQLESPPAVSIERQRIMERLIPKAHRAVLGFDGMDIHYGNEGESRLFTPAGNACADTLLKGEASVRPLSEATIPLYLSQTYTTNEAPKKGFFTNWKPSIRRDESFDFCIVNKWYGSDLWNWLPGGGNPRPADAPYKDGTLSSPLYWKVTKFDGTVVEPSAFRGKPVYGALWHRKMDSFAFFSPSLEAATASAITPRPIYGWRAELRPPFIGDASLVDSISFQTISADMGNYTLIKKWGVAFDQEKLRAISQQHGYSPNAFIEGLLDNEADSQMWWSTYFLMPNGIASFEEWMSLYLDTDPKATSDTWMDFNEAIGGVVENVDIALEGIGIMYEERPAFISKFSLVDFRDIFIPYPREWA